MSKANGFQLFAGMTKKLEYRCGIRLILPLKRWKKQYSKLIILYRHSGEGRARSETFSTIQVESRSWFSGCRIKSGMTENYELSSVKKIDPSI
jgi:hypothetical protein